MATQANNPDTKPIALAEINGQNLPQGTRKIRTVDDVTFYHVAWTIAVRDSEIYLLGGDDANGRIAQLVAIEGQIKQTQERLASLIEETQRITEMIAPPAPAKRKRAKAVREPKEPKETICCGVDGCEVQKPSGKSMNLHRVRQHPAWVEWQASLEAEHPLKAAFGGVVTPTAGRADNNTAVAPQGPTSFYKVEAEVEAEAVA